MMREPIPAGGGAGRAAAWAPGGGAGRAAAWAPGGGAGRAAAWAPGTWGELVQGTLDGEDFLVTCPIDRYVLAVARAAAGDAGAGWQGPAACPRTRGALSRVPGAGRVWLRSPLRPGAGMASSTADLSAALAAAMACAGRFPGPDELFRLCLELEPTDGLMFPGIARVDHRRGQSWQALGPPPPVDILGIDPGGAVCTADFNRRPDLALANRRKEPAVRVALELVTRAVRTGDPAALGAAATLSARAHQGILPNPLWEQAEALATACGAVGLNVAHSGTVIGFLFDRRRADTAAAAAWLQQRLGLPVRHLRLVGGGVTAAVCRGQGPT